MGQKNLKKKTVSLLLAAAMILTSFPVFGKEVRAAETKTSDHSLSVTAFATKDQLMEAFTPDGNGSSSTIGKLAFGKNSENEVQEWYILGKDDGVADDNDNTVLFAAGPIATGKMFNASTNMSYKDEWGCVYTVNAPASVKVNHYGGSDLRAELNKIAVDSQYFTTAEQGLMNRTTVTTRDTQISEDYTTTDKLYALTADGSGSSYTAIKAGTKARLVLAMSTYWSSGSEFWLRTPAKASSSSYAMAAGPDSYVNVHSVTNSYALVPAFNLKLSSVIFASAAKAASSENAETGTIANGIAMTLRLNGSDKTIGTVVYDETTGKIVAQEDANAEETVSLVVQGNDGTDDWYYSVQAGETTVVTKEQIQTACGISGDISFADCKIWLETTIDNVAYAKMAVVKITDSMVTIASGPHYYTGSAVTPDVTVTDGSKTLVSGTDYTVSYENNTNVGTATVTVTGKGNYTGTIGKTFDIILTDVDKVAAAKRVVEETLAGIAASNSTTTQEIQDKIDTALTNAGISDVTVTVGELNKTEATTGAAGSVSGNVSITKGSASDSVAISKTIAQLSTHTHAWTWVITKVATADGKGKMTGTCTCGEITTEVIPKTGESGSGTVIVKEDKENECNGSLADKEDVKGKVSLTDTEKEHLNTGEDLVIILRLKDVNVAADTQEKTEIQNKLETNTLGTFLDIELLKQIGGTETKITETTDEIEITFEIPEYLRNTDDTVTRTYQIMRHHDGVVDILNVENYDEAAHMLTFKTDKFSTYALVYRDTAKVHNTTGTDTEPVANKPIAKLPEDSIITPQQQKNDITMMAGMKVSQPGKKISISWGKVKGADGYQVYVTYCGKDFAAKPAKTVKSASVTKVTVKKINGKKLNLKKNYKVYITAYKTVNGKKVVIGKTLIGHIVGKNNYAYTNVKQVRLAKSKFTLKAEKTAKIKAKTVLVDKKKKQLSNAHAQEFRYATSNKEVAIVSKKGKIKAVGKGTCTIYVYARNGYAKKIKVKVK